MIFLAVMPNLVDVTANAATGWFVSNDFSWKWTSSVFSDNDDNSELQKVVGVSGDETHWSFFPPAGLIINSLSFIHFHRHNSVSFGLVVPDRVIVVIPIH